MSDPSLPEDDQKMIRRSENGQKIIKSDDQIVTIAFGPSQSGREAKLTKSDGLAVDVQPVVIILIFYHHHQIFYNQSSFSSSNRVDPVRRKRYNKYWWPYVFLKSNIEHRV